MKDRRFTISGAVVFAAAALAGWYSVREPDTIKAGAVVAGLPATSPAGPSKGRIISAEDSLAAMERRVRSTLDTDAETFRGERLMELCQDPRGWERLGPDPSFTYAKNWAQKNPQAMFDWFNPRGQFALPAAGGVFHAFLSTLFKEWSLKDPSAALAAALTCASPRERSAAVMEVINTLRKSDPSRAAALAAEHIALFDPGSRSTFMTHGADSRETWDFLCALPAGKNRDGMLAGYFDDLLSYRGEECEKIWSGMSDELRRTIVNAGLKGFSMTEFKPAALKGLDELQRAHIAATGDREAARLWLRNGARTWAEQDPAAAIAWAQENLKGDQRVTGTAQLFSAGAASDFAVTLRAWQALPDGVTKARAAGNMAAGAPAARKAEATALLESLSAGDRNIANAARAEAQGEQAQRAAMDNMLKEMRNGAAAK